MHVAPEFEVLMVVAAMAQQPSPSTLLSLNLPQVPETEVSDAVDGDDDVDGGEWCRRLL